MNWSLLKFLRRPLFRFDNRKTEFEEFVSQKTQRKHTPKKLLRFQGNKISGGQR